MMNLLGIGLGLTLDYVVKKPGIIVNTLLEIIAWSF